jgi:integrase
MILVAYRHGLRAAELTDLRWEQMEFRTARLHVRRVKQGTPSTHPVLGDELRALRRLQREVVLRVHVGARGTVQHGGVCPDG